MNSCCTPIKGTPAFDTEQEAREWMFDTVDDPFVDNVRFAFNDDAPAVLRYNAAMNDGCCGSFDREVLIAGRVATIGCNYGH